MSKKLILSLAFGGAVLSAASAFAGANAPDTRDVVRDARGNIVMNTFDNCVRTKWEMGSDACGAAPAVVPVRQPVQQPVIYK